MDKFEVLYDMSNDDNCGIVKEGGKLNLTTPYNSSLSKNGLSIDVLVDSGVRSNYLDDHYRLS